MSNSFRLGQLSELIDFKNGKATRPDDGNIPIYGGNGVLGYSSEHNFSDTLIIGRVGAYCGSVHIEKGKCWVSDNAIAGVPKPTSDNVYNYYLLTSLGLNKKQVGSSQPLLTQGILNNIKVRIEFDICQVP
jgi:type I restriction enzyme S subunit